MKYTTIKLRDAIREAIEDEHSLEDILSAIKDEYDGLQTQADDNGDDTDYYQLNAESVQDLIDSLP